MLSAASNAKRDTSVVSQEGTVMANAGLVLVWKQVKTGREAQALELFGSTMSYYTQQRERGNIQTFEPVLLQAHGGDVDGFIHVRGTEEQIDTLRRSDEFRSMTMQCIYCLDGFGVIDAYTGDELTQMMAEWGQLIGKG